MGRALDWSHVRLGLFLIAAFSFAALAIFFVDRLGHWAEYRYRLRVYAESARNLGPGSPVWLAGVPVGRVWAIDFRGAHTPVDRRIRIEIRLRRDAQPLVTQGSRVRVVTAGTLGEVVLEITPPPRDAPPIPDHSVLLAAPPADFPEVAERFRELRLMLPDALDRLRTLRSRIAEAPHLALLDDDGPLLRLERQIQAARIELGSRNGTLSRLASDRELHAALPRIARRLRQLAEQIESDEGSLGRFARDTLLDPTMESVLDRAALLRARIHEGKGTAGRWAHDRELWIQWERARRALETARERAGRDERGAVP